MKFLRGKVIFSLQTILSFINFTPGQTCILDKTKFCLKFTGNIGNVKTEINLDFLWKIKKNLKNFLIDSEQFLFSNNKKRWSIKYVTMLKVGQAQIQRKS